jgi:PDZ domain-containing protein
VSVTLGTREDDPTIGFLGIGPQTRWEDVEDLPVDVGVRTDQVGGNSAGLALTLAILDLLTPGELTGGLQVAGTGTIDLEGQVGPIGGIRQKVIAARRAGMDVLLVPRNELPEALDVAGDLQVEGVATLDEALTALAGLGGNADSLALPAGS